MTDPFLSQRAQPCIWMTAGLVAYKLCDRDFDCEHCPLDAALRGDLRSLPHGVPLPSAYTATFPEDRLYSSGHLWLQLRGEAAVEAGERRDAELARRAARETGPDRPPISGRRVDRPWGCSSAGRAPAWHAGGRGFESPQLHHPSSVKSWWYRDWEPPSS